jgi:tetratricopeptide (TPR) repeat protein
MKHFAFISPRQISDKLADGNLQQIGVRRAILFLVFLFFFSLILPAQNGPRHALIIGNADYHHINKLTNTVKDARDMAAALSGLGFQVDLRLDVTDRQFAEAVRAYTAKLASDPQSEGFFWFTGHGAQMAGENYMLPVDISAGSAGELREHSFSLNQLLGELEFIRNRVNILVVDACRTDPFPAARRNLRSDGLAAIRDVPGDLVVMFSTAPDNTASDGPPGTNSPFAKAFLKYIASPEPVNMMIPDVVRETMIITEGEQRPFMNGSIITNKYYSLNPVRTGTTPSGTTVAASVPAASVPAVVQAPEEPEEIAEMEETAEPEETAEMVNKTGIALFAGGEFDNAIAAFSRAIALKPDFAEAFYNRGLVWHEKNEPDRAIADFDQAVRFDPLYFAAYFNRGLAYSDGKDYTRALADYNETIRLNPLHSKAHNNRGNIYVIQNDYPRALTDYTTAIRLNPQNSAAYRNRGALYRVQGRQGDADADFAAARRLGWRE